MMGNVSGFARAARAWEKDSAVLPPEPHGHHMDLAAGLDRAESRDESLFKQFIHERLHYVVLHGALRTYALRPYFLLR